MQETSTGPELDLEAISRSGSTPATALAASSVTVAFLVLHGPSGAVTTPKSGKAVSFTVISGGGTVGGGTTTTVSTGANGVALVSWQLGGSAGPNVLRGSINGTQSLDVSVTGIMTVTPKLTLAVPPSSSPQSGIPFFQQPVAQLSDPDGNPVAQAGVPVTVSVASGSGTLGIAGLAALTVNSDANGQARFADLALTGGGTTTLQFAAPGYASVSSAALAVNGSPLVTALTNGNEFGPFGSIAGSQLYASFVVPAGSTDFRVGLYNGTGTAQLYARRGNYPTATAFDCASRQSGPSQLCSFASPTAGQWYLAANGVTTYQNVLARAVAYGPSCARQALGLGSTTNGVLNGATDCLVPSGKGIRDRYSFAPAAQQTVTFTVISSDLVAVELKSASSSRLRYAVPAGGGVSLPFLFAPGDHDVEVVDNTVAQTGGQSYSITPAITSANLAACNPVGLFEPGVLASLMLVASDCAGISAGTSSDRFFTYALTGQTLTVTMASAAFDPLLRVLDGQTLGAGTVLSSDDNGGGGTTARLVYTNPGAPGNFTIEASSAAAGATGAYTLTFDLAPAVYNAPPAFGVTASHCEEPKATQQSQIATAAARPRDDRCSSARPGASARSRAVRGTSHTR